MILRYTMYLLIACVSLFPAKAMDDGVGDDADNRKIIPPLQPPENREEDWVSIKALEPVTVHIWPSLDWKGTDEHVAVETAKHYMSFRPVSEKINDSTYVGYVNFNNPSFASPSLTIDQLIQDQKLNVGTLSEGAKTWPHKTVTLRLNTTAMDRMWEALLDGSSPTHDGGIFTGKVFKNVHYTNYKMRMQFDRDIKNQTRCSSFDTTLYFTNTGMAFGLLGKGGMFAKDIYYLDYPGYFGVKLAWPSLPTFQTSFIQAIKENFYTRALHPSVEYLSTVLQEASRRQELIRIHRRLEDYKLPSLSRTRQNVIIKMVENKKSQDEVENHLLELGNTYHSQNSYLSPTGWTNTLFYGGEW